MKRMWMSVLAGALLGGCSYYPGYEQSVQDREPVYCYRSFADQMVLCYPTPNHRDERSLVNYFGPAPRRYERPPPPPPERLVAPPMIQHWVKDPEPVPRADPPRRM